MDHSASRSFATLPGPAPLVFIELNRCLGLVRDRAPALIPDFATQQDVLCVSDYAGDHAGARSEAYSFVFLDWQSCEASQAERDGVRAKHACHRRRFEYKKLNTDRCKLAALPEFLRACDSLSGIAITVVIDRSIKTVFGDAASSKRQLRDILASADFGDWKPEVAERIFRIAHCQALLAAGLLQHGQGIFWHMDSDPVTAHMQRFTKIVWEVMSIYMSKLPRGIMLAPEPSRSNPQPPSQNSMLFPDLLAISDLTAGAACMFNDRIWRAIDAGEHGTDDLNLRDQQLIAWLCNRDTRLAKLMVRVSHGADDRIRIHAYKLAA